MQNFNRFGLGTDITKPVGYAMSTTDRIGAVDLQFENLGTGLANSYLKGDVASMAPDKTATVAVKYFTPSGVVDSLGVAQGTWTQLVAPFTITPGGKVTQHVVIFAKKIAVFGSGNTTVSLEIPNTHAAALRGGHIDIEPAGRQAFGFDPGTDRNLLFPAPLQ